MSGAAGNPIRVLLHVPVPWVFVLTYLLGMCLEIAWPIPAAPAVLRVEGIAGPALFVVGLALAAWSLLLFRKARTTTVPGRVSASLVTSGPYRVTRNPMYVALSLAYLGEAGMLRQIWPILLLPLTLAYVHGVVVPVEEARLREAFPTEYGQYCARVRRRL
jgi:protein-S-isoprenylcysteine O-methyltransferase Ste14